VLQGERAIEKQIMGRVDATGSASRNAKQHVGAKDSLLVISLVESERVDAANPSIALGPRARPTQRSANVTMPTASCKTRARQPSLSASMTGCRPMIAYNCDGLGAPLLSHASPV